MIDGEIVGGLGYFGMFLIALISNAIPYSTIPYLAIIAPILAKLNGFELIYAIIALSMGASLGKIFVYSIGRGISKIGFIDKLFKNMYVFTHRYKKVTFITVFLVASLPIPDDVFYIPIGASKYNVLLFFIALLIGKTIVTILTALYGRVLGWLLEETANLPPVIYVPLMIVITILITLVINRIDWFKLGKIYEREVS